MIKCTGRPFFWNSFEFLKNYTARIRIRNSIITDPDPGSHLLRIHRIRIHNTEFYFCLNFVIVSFSRLVGICVGCGISGCCGTRAQNFFKRFSETTLHLGCWPTTWGVCCSSAPPWQEPLCWRSFGLWQVSLHGLFLSLSLWLWSDLFWIRIPPSESI
jgi:hypothetical protein